MDVKDELKNTSIQITCLDEEGNVLKRVTSTSGEVEDPDASTGSETDPSAPSTSSGTESGTEVHNGSGIIPTPTDPEDDQPSD